MTRSIGRTAGSVGIAILVTSAALSGAASAAGAGPGIGIGSRADAGARSGRQASAAPAAAVPHGFKAASITWTTRQHGWVLGAAPCGKKTCSDVIATTDGGTTWRLLGAVNSPLATMGQAVVAGITEIRFATAKVGWAFAPYLFHTTDGGSSWASMKIPGGGKQVIALAANATGAYAVVSTCKWAMGGLCPISFWRTSALTGSSWTRIPLNLPKNITAEVAASGKTVYVVDPLSENSDLKDVFYASTDDGLQFSSRTVPCDNAEHDALIGVAASSQSDVALLCEGNPGTGLSDKYVYTSSNTAKSYRFAGHLAPPNQNYGIQAELAESPSGNLAVATSSDGSLIFVNDTHKRTWTMLIAKSDGGAGWNDIVYVSNEEAWVVYAPVDDFSGIGQVYVTHDGGHHWSVAAL